MSHHSFHTVSSRNVALGFLLLVAPALASPAQAQQITVEVSGVVSEVFGWEHFRRTFASAPGSVVQGSMTYQCPGQDMEPANDVGFYALTLLNANATIMHDGDNYTWSGSSVAPSTAIANLNDPSVDAVLQGAGNGICEMNEGCVSGDHSLTETADCGGVTSGPSDQQYCFIEGVCVDKVTDPSTPSPCPDPPPGPESLTLTAALTGDLVACVPDYSTGQFPSGVACWPFLIKTLGVFLGDRYGNGLTSDRHPTEIVLSDWHHKDATLTFDDGELRLSVSAMSVTGSCPAVPVDGNLTTYLGPTPPPFASRVRAVRWPLGNGELSFTVAGSAGVDVRLIDDDSVRIGPNQAPLSGSGQFVRQDYNGDGYLDARGSFRPSEAGMDATSTELCTAMTFIGATVRSCTELSRRPVVDDEPVRSTERVAR
jgi:hypothetical protein